MKDKSNDYKYPGIRSALDGNSAVIMCERESSDAAGAYPITPSTQMGEYWAEEMAKGHLNISEKPLIFIEPEGEHAAAGVTAGLAMTGLRSINFSSGQGIVYMHESLYAAVGKRLPYILNMGCRAITKTTLNVHAGHDDYHAVDDTGFFQVFGKDVQSACDLNIIAHKIAELSLTPGIVAQDGFLTTHLIDSIKLPERDLILEYLGKPSDMIESPTPSQKIIYGKTRRRIPLLWDVDNPMMSGVVQNQDAYMQTVASQRPFFFDHIQSITDRCMAEFCYLTGRWYNRVDTYKMEDADYVILGQGSVVSNAEAVADYFRKTRNIKVGVINIVMYRPFPGDLLGKLIKGRKGVAILERVDQPLAEDLPLMRETRCVINKCIENGQVSSQVGKAAVPYPGYDKYKGFSDISPMYSGSFGLGSRDLQPEALIGAVENMLPTGRQKKNFYLSIDFFNPDVDTPAMEIHQNKILEAYPEIKELSVSGSENPNLMPDKCLSIRFHSIGGWGAITTGKNLALTLFELLGHHIKANPKYGSEKKGQPTTYYLAVAPEPIRLNCEFNYVDVVLSPDPNVFKHTNALKGMKKGGLFIIQSELGDAQQVWDSIPEKYQKQIVDGGIRIFYLDGFKIAREEASNPELQFRMQGIAFQGAFFAASDLMQENNLTEQKLFDAIEEQLKTKFGQKGEHVVKDNLRVVQRGFKNVHEITEKPIKNTQLMIREGGLLPESMKNYPSCASSISDINYFWQHTGRSYIVGKGNDNVADPFMSLSVIPASTGLMRDMTGIRFEHPIWIAENCTGCGECWTVCPDSAMPSLINTAKDILNTAILRAMQKEAGLELAKKAVTYVERTFLTMLEREPEAIPRSLLISAIDETVKRLKWTEEEKLKLKVEYERVKQELSYFSFARTKPFFNVLEKKGKGKGGFLSITIDPYSCKGCMACIEVCGDDALAIIKQTEHSVEELQENWDYWAKLPDTEDRFLRIDDMDEKIGILHNLLLKKANYGSMVGGDGACLGCGEKTVIHIFLSTIEALMQPRVKKFIARLDGLIQKLESHMRIKLAETVNFVDVEAMDKAIDELGGDDIMLSNLSAAIDKRGFSLPIDPAWLKHVVQLLKDLKDIKWRYITGDSGRGRASLGIINSTGCTSVWGSTYPFNPYPFPWSSHLFQDSPSVAMGLFEGLMRKMADMFKVVRIAEMELANNYDKDKQAPFFTYFDWEDFSDDEFALCPPVVAMGGDGAFYDIGFQNLSRMMMSGKPIKVFVVDTQVYSNTGGQACTSGFMGQISDMAQFGKQMKGKSEIRKEMSLIALAHRSTFVLQSSQASTSHMIEGFIDGLASRRPALFNIYTACPPEHGVADDLSDKQAKLSLESRAYPFFRYNPDRGNTIQDCIDIEGNPCIDQDWPTYELKYKKPGEGTYERQEVAFTFADFAYSEARFRKHFSVVKAGSDEKEPLLLADFLRLSENDRADKMPFIWAINALEERMKIGVSETLVAASMDRLNFWNLLKDLAGKGKHQVDVAGIQKQVRRDTVDLIIKDILQGAGAKVGAANRINLEPGKTSAHILPSVNDQSGVNAVGNADYLAPWIDSDECTTCDECIKINSQIFGYNEQKKAVILDENAGTYSDLVRAAEKCSAEIIHPGLPKNLNEPGIEKMIKRGDKFN